VRVNQIASSHRLVLEDVVSDGRPGDSLCLLGQGLGNFNPLAQCILVSHGTHFLLPREKDHREATSLCPYMVIIT
jgi:hypothetical protein